MMLGPSAAVAPSPPRPLRIQPAAAARAAPLCAGSAQRSKLRHPAAEAMSVAAASLAVGAAGRLARARRLQRCRRRGAAVACGDGGIEVPGMPRGVGRRHLVGGAALLSASGAPHGAQAEQVTQAATVPTVSVGSLQVSRTIQGYWQLAGGHGRYEEAAALKDMRQHFASGITTLDTADIYGPSEVVVGKFVKEEPSAVPCTKFCCFRDLQTIDKRAVRSRVEEQLRRLQVSALPLTAFFWLDYNVPRYVEVAQMLADLRRDGLIQEIGVTNFDTKRLRELVDAGVPVVSNQVQLSVLDRRPLEGGMASYCITKGIKLITYGTVGGGLLSERYLGQPEPNGFSLDTPSLRMYYGSARRFVGSWELFQELLSTMKAVGEKHGASIANVAQRYVLDSSPAVASVLVGVRNSEHIAENVRTHAFTLDQSDKTAIDAVLNKGRGPIGDVYGLERGEV